MTTIESVTKQPRRIERARDDVSSEMVTVEFTVPACVGGTFADVIAEFLTWVPLPMDRLDDGSFVATIRLQPGCQWRYRFLVDGERWINDWCADDYVTSVDGSCMSLLRT
jgi:hypothetical protein